MNTRHSSSSVICIMFLGTALVAAPTPADVAAPFSDAAVRAAAVRAFTEQSQHDQAVAVAWAQQHGLPVRYDVNGVTRELMRLDAAGQPLYYSTFNVNAAISTAADVLRDLPVYGLAGNNVTVGVWDGGTVLSTHQEFGGRVQVMDGAASHWHSTHVGGTIAASGVDANARGMAPSCHIHSYDWNTDIAEMTARGASAPGQGDKLYLSNHSYGLDGGWFWDSAGGSGWHWRRGLGTLQDPTFGQYGDEARNLDTVAYGAPYYLIICAAGNDRDDNPANGDTVYHWNGSSFIATTYNSATHPLGDGAYKGGYDCMSWYALAKNSLTIGAVNDAVVFYWGFPFRSPAAGTMAGFSAWGPTDDGRIKPDVVGNGVDLYSTHNAGNAAYATAGGTSMSSPNVCGTAALLLEYFRRFGNEPRASTMKALLIHTADDIGTAGPDYAYGWGLVNGWAAADLIAGDHRGMGVTHIREALRTDADDWLEYTYTSAGVAPFKATLCWTDPPGTTTTGDDDRTRKLVNDLDLRVIDPNTTTHYPFHLDYNNPGAAATRADNSVDNVEQVLIDAPVAGTYTVRVRRWGALTAPQYFSLIVTSEPYPLAAPGGISASDGTYSFYVRVTWNTVAGANTYKVYRNTVNNSSTATLLTSISGTAYNDTGAAHDKVYYYWVKASSTLSDSSFSGSNSGFLEPNSPTGLAASDGDYLNQVKLTWTAVGGASSYAIYRSQDGAPGTSVLLGNSATASYLDTTVIHGTTYWYWVKTVMSGVSSYYSSGNDGYALLTLTCPLWTAHQAKKNSTIKGKETTPALEALLAQGWQVGIATVSGNAATPHAGPYLLTPNKKHTVWKFKAKKNATVNYTVRKHVFKTTVWTNLPPTWVIYARP
ncbi:MAG: S8 family serine peptidase [bacterium]|nr:S8 family serine peptidase [bacterium]